MSNSSHFTVKAVAKALGVSPNTVRAWENRYKAVTPIRTETNRRVYSAEQVERLKLILKLVNEGHGVGTIASLPEKKLRQLIQSEKHGSRGKASHTVPPFIEKLSRYDFPALAEELDRSRLTHSTRGYVLDVLSPLLREVGTLVSKGKLSIAQEHALAAMIRDQIGQVIQALRRKAHAKGPTLLFATPEGDLHEFGILLAAALCAHHGHRAYYLGSNLPAEALAIAADALKPDIVVLGNSPTSIAGSPSLERFLKDLSQSLKPKVQVWIGGQGEIPHLRAIFGKRGYRVLASLSDFDAQIGKL